MLQEYWASMVIFIGIFSQCNFLYPSYWGFWEQLATFCEALIFLIILHI